MNLKKLLAVTACVAALCMGLVACTGNSSSSSAASSASAEIQVEYPGTWELASTRDAEGHTMTSDELKALEEMGLPVFLNLNEDGTATFVIFNVPLSGTWEKVDATTLSLTIDGEYAAATYEEGLLFILAGDSELGFTRSDPREVPAAGSDAAHPGVSELAGALALTGETQEMNAAVIADDDTCKITAVAKTMDVLGDPGYDLVITNKIDRTIYVMCDFGSFSVAGTPCEGYVFKDVKPNETITANMYFSGEELAISSLDGLKDVTGTLIVYDDATMDELGKYPVTL